MGIVFCCLTFPLSARTETAMGWAGLSGIGKLSASVRIYSGLTLKQDKAMKPQTVRQGNAVLV